MVMQFTGEMVVEGDTPERIWQDHIARYRFACRYVKGKKVLDIACGTGHGSKLLCEAGAKRVIGVDISGKAINFATSRYKINGLEFKIGNILNIDFPENYFDVITCFETIEHVQSQEKAFRELRRVLSSDGLLIISSPNRRLTSPGKSIGDRPDNPFHTKEYSTREFISILKNYYGVVGVYGQRAINKVFLLPFFERITRRILPMTYDSSKGSSELEKASLVKEYRYITVVCRKN